MNLFLRLFFLTALLMATWNDVFASDLPAAEINPAVTTASPSTAPERTLYDVTVKDAEKMIGDALIAGGAGSQIQVTLIGNRSHPLAQGGAPVLTNVQELAYDAKSGRWSAMLTFQSEGSNLTPVRVQGRYEQIALVPMLTKTVDSGVKIEKSDIDMTPLATSRLHKDTILKAEDMIGKTPKRGIGPNRPIRLDELTDAADVRKGSQVKLQYRIGGLSIDTVGLAMEPGTVGSAIRVQNTASKAIVTGTLENDNVVMVSSTSQH